MDLVSASALKKPQSLKEGNGQLWTYFGSELTLNSITLETESSGLCTQAYVGFLSLGLKQHAVYPRLSAA